MGGSARSAAQGLHMRSILAAGIYSYETERDPPPELAPDRKISEQDCTRPIDPTLGNLRCK